MEGDTVGVVRDLARGGDAVCETAHGLVFARGGLPGEQVILRNVQKRGKIARGRIVKVTEPSVHRVSSPCEWSDACGGCPWIHASRDLQSERKVGFLRDAITRAGHRDPGIEWIPSAGEFGYRRRARMMWGRGGRLGYRVANSKRITNAEHCAVLTPPLADILPWFRAELSPWLKGQGQLRLYEGAEHKPVVRMEAWDAQPPEVYQALDKAVSDARVAGAGLRVEEAGAFAEWGDSREWVAHPDGDWLVGPAGGFAQANDGVSAQLYAKVMEWAAPSRGTRVLELYAGSGHFTVGLARLAKEVRAVEIDQAAVAAGRENLKRRGLKARWVSGASEDYANSKGFDCVVLDPPRTGARDALSSLVLGGAPRVVYVSCDTATLGRDLSELGRGGYRVQSAAAFDMFPQTSHLESLVLLVRG